MHERPLIADEYHLTTDEELEAARTARSADVIPAAVDLPNAGSGTVVRNGEPDHRRIEPPDPSEAAV
jgi:hypothetical protein